MTLTNVRAEELATAGAEWLDTRYGPAWRDLVKREGLKMSSVCGCVLGQVAEGLLPHTPGSPRSGFMRFRKARMDELGGSGTVFSWLAADKWMHQHGFDIDPAGEHQTREEREDDYATLQRAWERLLWGEAA